MTLPGLSQFKQKASPIEQRSVAFGSISATYTLVGSLFLQPIVLLIISSTLDQAVQLSWDGVTDHVPVTVTPVPLVISFKNNEIVFPGYFGVYVKEIGNPTAGSLYISGFSL